MAIEPPSFFIPDASTPEQAEKVWEATRKFARDTTGRDATSRRIFRLRYRHNGKVLTAEVGKPEPLTGETVLVILESDPYLICTPTRGVLSGMPILAGRDAVVDLVEFENGEQ